jgi:UTP--glucose-1-phosphate uridylyltransferase
MTKEAQNQFGRLLRQARDAAGLSREHLARRVGLDASYIYRLELGDRRPGRDTTLALADALAVAGEELSQWLVAAGFAPMPLLTSVRAAVRTRGGRRRLGVEHSATWDAARWAEQLEAMGLRDAMIGRLLRVMETAEPALQQTISTAISTAIARAIETLEAPVRTAVIPAAGGQHQLVAPHVMQRLLLRAIGEAAGSGINKIVVVLAPGMAESLFAPLKEALELAIVPAIKIQSAVQAIPEGLGDAILQAEKLVGEEPFAVLLPDDVVQEQTDRPAHPRELCRMMRAFSQLDDAYLVAVASVPKSKMPQYGVVRVGAKEVMPDLLPVVQLVEKPAQSHAILRSVRILGIVGRYLLRPDIFHPLRELREKGGRPVQLTTALEMLRRAGQSVYAFELRAGRQDVGEMIGQASELIRDSSPSSFKP